MANYPPPPPGGYGPPGGAPGWGGPQDPYARDRALVAWASERKYELSAQPDPGFYLSWYPFAYLPRPSNIVRDLRVTLDDAKLFVAQGTENDPLRQMIEGSQMLLFFLLSPRLRCRASVSSKMGGGIDKEIGRELSNIFGSARPAGSILGDPTLESRFEVTTPSRDEGNWALPMPLRQMLVQPNFRGILETRAGGMAVLLHDYKSFDPYTLDGAIHIVNSLYQAAVSQSPPVPG